MGQPSTFHVPIFYTLREMSHQRALLSGRFIVLNDSTSPKIVIKLYFNFFWFWMSSCLNVDEVTPTWLLIGTSFASLTRNNASGNGKIDDVMVTNQTTFKHQQFIVIIGLKKKSIHNVLGLMLVCFSFQHVQYILCL